jgi:tetratricopeptide (TPR) repeat protein
MKLRKNLLCCCAVCLATLSLAVAAQTPKPQALDRASEAFKAGVAARAAGNLELARTRFSEVVRLAPKIAEGHEALAAVLVELAKPNEAVPEFETALKLKPDDPGIEADLALAYAKGGNPGKSVPLFAAVYAARQDQAQTVVDGAFCEAYARELVVAGKPDEAIQIFNAAVEKGGPRADLADAIGSLYAQKGKWAEARPQFEQAVSLDQTAVLPRIHLGIVEREQHDLDDSAAALEAAVRLAPGNAMAQFEYGRTLAAGGKDEAATTNLEEAAKLNPQLPGVQNELAMALQRQGRQDEAIPWFRAAVEREPKNFAALTNLGLALTLTGKAKEGLEFLAKAIELRPKDVTILKDRGVAHIQLSAFDEAIGDFQAALALDGNDPQLHYDLGLAYKFKDRVDEAIAELKRAGEMDPTLQDPPYTLGILYMQIGKLDEAAVELKKAVALRPDSGDAWAILGSTLKQASRLAEAKDALEHAIPLQPGQPGPRVTLAAVLAELAGTASADADASEAAGDAKKAEQLRAEVQEYRKQAAEYRHEGADLARSAVNRQKAHFALNAGNQLLLRGDVAGAVARYQESIAADATFAEAHGQLAAAYERQGRAEDATSERAKAAGMPESK